MRVGEAVGQCRPPLSRVQVGVGWDREREAGREGEERARPMHLVWVAVLIGQQPLARVRERLADLAVVVSWPVTQQFDVLLVAEHEFEITLRRGREENDALAGRSVGGRLVVIDKGGGQEKKKDRTCIH